MKILGPAAALTALLSLSIAPALAKNPVELQRQYKAAKGQFLMAAPAQMNLAEVHARLLAFLDDTGSEVQESGPNEIMARTTFAAFADPVLVAIPIVVVDVNYQRAMYEATGEPVYQNRQITLTQEKDGQVLVQFCSRVKQYSPRSNGPPEVRVATRCKLDFREWNALREVTERLFD